MKSKILLFALGASTLLLSLYFPASNTTEKEKGLIKISIMYPNAEGKTFNMDYYAEKHMPMVAELFGSPLKGYGIEKGISGRTREDPIPYLAVGYFLFESIDEYNKAFGPNAQKILGDIPNYTDIQPMILISEVVH